MPTLRISYLALSRQLGVSRQHLSRALQGQSGLSFSLACRIADALGVTLETVRDIIAHATSRRRKAA